MQSVPTTHDSVKSRIAWRQGGRGGRPVAKGRGSGCGPGTSRPRFNKASREATPAPASARWRQLIPGAARRRRRRDSRRHRVRAPHDQEGRGLPVRQLLRHGGHAPPPPGGGRIEAPRALGREHAVRRSRSRACALGGGREDGGRPQDRLPAAAPLLEDVHRRPVPCPCRSWRPSPLAPWDRLLAFKDYPSMVPNTQQCETYEDKTSGCRCIAAGAHEDRLRWAFGLGASRGRTRTTRSCR